MANRRMFSNRIANSARFLQMPAEAQLLYFHMILRADDDGVVESYPLIKLLGVPPDNFKILLAKSFIRQLNEDQVIVIIDWLEHNTIRADRKVDSIYKTLLLNKAPDFKTITPKPRSDVEDNSQRLGGQSTDGISQVRLGQVKLSKDKINEDGEQSSREITEIFEIFQKINPTINYGNKTQRLAVSEMIKKISFQKTKDSALYAVSIQSQQYAPTITTPYQLKTKLGDLIAYHSKEKNKKDKIIAII